METDNNKRVEADETKLFEEIAGIPLYQNKFLSLLDREDEEGLVEDNFDRFKELYTPIAKTHFKEAFDWSDGKIKFDNDESTRKLLASHLNDNVLKNIGAFSVKLFDESQPTSKSEYTMNES